MDTWHINHGAGYEELLTSRSRSASVTGAEAIPAAKAAWILATHFGEDDDPARRRTLVEVCNHLMLVQGRAATAETRELRAHVIEAVRRGDVVLMRRPTHLQGTSVARRKGDEPPAPAPAPEVVNPIIEPASLVVVVRKFATNPATHAREPYTNPARRAITLRTDAAFDGTGTFSCDHPNLVRFFSAATGGTEIHINGTDNVFRPGAPPAWASGASLASGVTIFVEGAAHSTAMDDIHLRLSLSGGSRANGPDDTATVTSIELTLDIHKSRPEGGGNPPVFSQDDKIHKGRFLIGQKANLATMDHALESPHERAKVVIKKALPHAFAGTLVLRPMAANLQLFEEERPASGQPVIATPFTIANANVHGPGHTLWVEATNGSVSGALRDTGLQLGIQGVEPDGDRVNITILDVVLDVGQSRSAVPPAANPPPPAPMSVADKIALGRFLHAQQDHRHGRAALIVKKVRPETFTGTLVLKRINAKVSVFQSGDPSAAGGAVALPHEVPNATIPNDGLVLWVEGTQVSRALRDTGFTLVVKDELPHDGDRVNATVVKFSDLRIDIPSTPANQVRPRDDGGASNSPVARHTLTLGNGGTPANSDFNHDFAANKPIVLIEGSVTAANPINLSVVVAPAAAAPHVSWSIHRDRRTTAPLGDHANVIALDGNSEDPGLVMNAANRLQATLRTSAVGSFHIQPFIDNNGNGSYEFHDPTGQRIDREPYICMNLVLVRVEGVNNLTTVNSAAGSPNLTTVNHNYFGAGPIAMPGGVRTGDFQQTGNDAINMNAIVRVIGGGQDGKRGLTHVFSGWVNNELNCATSPGPGGLGEDVTHTFRRTSAAGAPLHPTSRTRCFWRMNGHEISGPMLDSGAYEGASEASGRAGQGRGGNTCTSTNSGTGNDCPVVKNDHASGIGQTWQVTNVDSPGGLVLWNHPADAPRRPPPAHNAGVPAANRRTLRNFKFNIDFRCDLVFWTNRDEVAGRVDRPACRLYSSVCSNTWNVRLESNFDDAFVETRVTPKTVNLNAEAFAAGVPRRARPVEGSGLETRAPDGLFHLQSDVPF